jgi:DNA-directed RNA polymerase specialized sigma24 family protein
MAKKVEDAYTSCRSREPNLSSEWRGVETVIHRWFRRKGVSNEQAEDLTQDVAAKMVGKVPQNPGRDGFLQLAHRTALSVWIDYLRLKDRRPVLTELGDADAASFDADALDRLNGFVALNLLTPREVEVLLDLTDEQKTPNYYVVKHRVRRKLEMIMSSLAGVFPWLRRSFSKSHRRAIPAALAAIIVVSVVVLDVDLRPHTHVTPTSPRERLRTEAPQAAAAPFGRGLTTTPQAAETRTVPPTTYDELISLPSGSHELTPLGVDLGTLSTRPTRDGDALLCYLGLPLVGDVCIGNASDVGLLLQRILRL